MQQTAKYFKDSYMKEPFFVDYDDEAPCIMCGEPVVGASMGGTTLCPWCDMGKCRYCKMTIFCFRESIDGGASKKNLLEHMEWHRERDPDFNKKSLEAHRAFVKEIKERESNA